MIIYRLLVKNFNIGHTLYVQSCLGRFYSKESKVMQKLMNKNGRKRPWREFDTQQGQVFMPSAAAISKGPASNKRVAVLNKLLMKNITDLMATGNCSEQLIGLGVEVTKVKVGTEFNLVSVYWICNGDQDPNLVDSQLRRIAGVLCQELTGLRILGRVPHIQFVRDRSRTSWNAVDHLLKIADMGEDYVPKGVDNLKTDFGNERLPLPATEENEDASVVVGDLPVMRQNVLGLDRAAILDRLLSSMKGRSPKKSEILSSGIPAETQPFDEKAFAEFLLTRKLARDRLAKYGNDVRRSEEIRLEDDDEFTEKDDDDDYWEEDCYQDQDHR